MGRFVTALCSWFAMASCATAPPPGPTPKVAPTESAVAVPATALDDPCPRASDDPDEDFAVGLEIVASTPREGDYARGLTYGAGLERLRSAAAAGHADAQHLYGFRRYMDAHLVAKPSATDGEARACYVEALAFLALAAEQGQLEARAFFPLAVLRQLLAPISPYVAVPELDATPLGGVPTAWLEEARLQVSAWRSCVAPPERAQAAPAPLPEAPRGFVTVPAGSFVMGAVQLERERSVTDDEDRAHRVTLTRPLFVQSTEVTRGQWRALMGSAPRKMPPCAGDLCPVSGVSWIDAVRYLNALSKRDKLPACYVVRGQDVTFEGVACGGYRLPTEAEWEYAARAGQGGERYGLVRDIARVQGLAATRPAPLTVGSLAANPWGLHDTLGNVSEWCHDWHDPYFEAHERDPVGPAFGSKRVVRGGAYDQAAERARFSARQRAFPRDPHPSIGLRAVRTALPEP